LNPNHLNLSKKFVLYGLALVSLTIILVNFATYRWYKTTIMQELSFKPLFIAKTGALLMSGEEFRTAFTQQPMDYRQSFRLMEILYQIRNQNNRAAIVSLYAVRAKHIRELMNTELQNLFGEIEPDSAHYALFEKAISGTDGEISPPYPTSRGLFISAFVPIRDRQKQVLGLIEVAYPADLTERLWQERKARLTLAYIIGFLVTFLVSIVAARRISRPIRNLTEAIRRLEQGDSAYPLNLGSSDEIGRLGQTFHSMRETINLQRQALESQRDELIVSQGELEFLNRSLDQEVERKTLELRQALAELQETQRQLIQNEKMASIGKLAGGIAHEINTPLAVILARAGLLLALAEDIPLPSEVCGDIEAIRNQSLRISKIIKSLLDYSRQKQSLKEPLDLNELAESCLLLAGESIRQKNIQVASEFQPDLPKIPGDRLRLEIVMINLIKNAVDAAPPGGRIVIMTGLAGVEARLVRLRISDSGSGILPEHLNKIFDPFFTTKEVGEGTGLGLYICYAIIDEHRGRIDVVSTPGVGTTFTVDLPR
jgi:signal transduction histidine kinase